MNFQVSAAIDEPWERNLRRSELLFAIWNGLKDAGIVIAYPQLDLHLDMPIPDSLRQIQRAG